jgi:hypothetical protein
MTPARSPFSNDTQPTSSIATTGAFTEKRSPGVAFSETESPAGMGVDASDYDFGLSQPPHHQFFQPDDFLYHNEGKGLFVDEAPRSDIRRARPPHSGIRCFSSTTISTAARCSRRQQPLMRHSASSPTSEYAMPPHLSGINVKENRGSQVSRPGVHNPHVGRRRLR